MTNRMRRFLYWLTTVVLAIGTAILCGWYAGHAMLRPWPISGPNKWGYDVTIVAMDGTNPVEMVHEWSGEVDRALRGFGNKPTTAALQAKVQSKIDQPIVWTNTGKAKDQFRYYLTNTDLPKVNSMLDSKPGKFPHHVRVEVLKDDPEHKRQTLQVTIHGDRSDFVTVYQVANNRVKPLKWRMYRGEQTLLMIAVLPTAFVVSGLVWRRLLRRLFLPAHLHSIVQE